ncbi:hypothetical protein SAMN05421503_2487 [Terribacillus aidingensis]|uniref:Uncharacterized protein n=1 Tax=Terribacillus aidingensis TaxID=586416 RepID=A0A285NYK5_9BACI|nr:hypothetical protein SAMN05421503_2487 [Terribacillus aidingensis]
MPNIIMALLMSFIALTVANFLYVLTRGEQLILSTVTMLLCLYLLDTRFK